MFWGDGRTSDPVPLDFLKARKAKFKGLNDDEKMDSVLNHLAMNSEAEVWFHGLGNTAKGNWKAFEVAFEKNWPREIVKPVTLAEKRARLTKIHLAAEDVLKVTEVNGAEMTGRAIWVSKVRRLAAQARDSDGALIGVVHEDLPDIIKKHMKSDFTDWDDFLKAVQDIKEADIRQSVKEDERITVLERDNRFLCLRIDAQTTRASPTSPTAPLRTMMRNFTVSHPPGPAPTPTTSLPHNDIFLQNGPMAPNNLFAGYARTNTRPATKRMADLSNNTWGRIHHGNTTAGWNAFESEQAEWKRVNPNKWAPDETCPYPLTPGTQPVGKGECYKCGHLHFKLSIQCPTPQVDPLETIYRGVAGKIIRESKRASGPYPNTNQSSSSPTPPIPSLPVPATVAAIQELESNQSLQYIPATSDYQAHYILVSSSEPQGNGEGPMA